MATRQRGIEVLGWLSAITGYGFGLMLIRGIFIGITRGFGASRSQAFWVVLGYLLCLGLAVYLINIGRRAISLAKGFPYPKMRFGWGRILIGAIFLYGNAARYFHLIPAHFKPLQSSNDVQALSTKITEAVLLTGFALLIFSGVWRGLRCETQPNASA